MRMNQRRAASPQQTQIGLRITCEHLPADARELPPFVEVLEREGACPVGREAETFPAHVKRSVPAQMLCLLGNEGLRDPEQVVAENRHFRQGVSGSDGLPALIQDFRRWNLHTIRPQAFNLSMDWRYRMIISRYLLREILGPLAVVLSVLCVLQASYGAASFLSDAVSGLLPTDMIVQVISLRSLIALEMLIPIALYLSVVMALGRMYVDSEMTALFALGLTPDRLMGIVFGLSLSAAVVVARLSLIARPWAYSRSHELASVAEASLNTNNMQAGTFHGGGKGERTIYLERREGAMAAAGRVFLQLRLRGGGTRIIYARSIEQTPHVGEGSQMRLSGAHVYDIDLNGGGSDVVPNADDVILQLPSPALRPPDRSTIASSTAL